MMPSKPIGRGRGVAITLIASSNLVANAVTFGATAVMTRLYSPTEFGTFSVLLALVMGMSAVAAVRLEVAVPLPTEEGEARAVLRVGFLAVAAVTITLLLSTFIIPPLWAAVPADGQPWLWAIPVLLVPVGTFQLLNAWALRHGRFVAIARRTILQAGATAAIQVVAGLVGLGNGGLVWGYFAGQAAGALSLLVGSGLRSKTTDQRVSSGYALRRYRRFPLILAPAGLLNSFGLNAPVLLVGNLYGAQAAGFFGLAARVLAVPTVLVAQATAQVFTSELAQLKRNAEPGALELFHRTSRNLAIAGTAVAVIIATTGPIAFEVVFGSDWEAAGHLARALAVMIGVQIVGYPVSQALIVYERSALQLCWDASRLAAVAATFVGMHQHGSTLTESALAYSGVMTAFYAISWLLCRRTIING